MNVPKLSTLAYANIDDETKKTIASPIKHEAQLFEKKINPIFKKWRKHYRNPREKYTLRDGRKTTKKVKEKMLMDWFDNEGENFYYYHLPHQIAHIIMALRDTREKNYQTSDLTRNPALLEDSRRYGRWEDLFNDWINDMSKEELKDFAIGYFNRNFRKVEPHDFCYTFLEYLHWNKYIDDPELQGTTPDNPIPHNVDIDRHDVGSEPTIFPFLYSYLSTLNNEQLSNLYNNIFFQTSYNNVEPPQEDTTHINNPRYFKPKFTVDGTIVAANVRTKKPKSKSKKPKSKSTSKKPKSKSTSKKPKSKSTSKKSKSKSKKIKV